MAWTEKAQPSPFDHQEIEGLFYLDGDYFARKHKFPTKGLARPAIAFPSGLRRELWTRSEHNVSVVHLFGEMDLPLHDTRDSAFTRASEIAEVCGYTVRKFADNGLEVFGHDDDEKLRILYDNAQAHMIDVIYLRDVPLPRPELLDQASRERLPPLYANEHIGLEALAQVKFFTPDAGWTWYASEFDGKDIFFGLVNGFELELGYFSLSELQQIRGGLGLPVERDRHFNPTTLRALKQMHEQERYGSGSGGQ